MLTFLLVLLHIVAFQRKRVSMFHERSTHCLHCSEFVEFTLYYKDGTNRQHFTEHNESDALQTTASASSDGDLYGGVACYKSILNNFFGATKINDDLT